MKKFKISSIEILFKLNITHTHIIRFSRKIYKYI